MLRLDGALITMMQYQHGTFYAIMTEFSPPYIQFLSSLFQLARKGCSMNDSNVQILTLIVGRDDGMVQSYFGVEHDGKLWLVNAWLIESATGIAIPERMVRVDSLSPRPQKCEPGEKFDYVNILLPQAVIDGPGDAPGYEIRILPDGPRVRREQLKPLPSVFG